MKRTKQVTPVRERILARACDLFYRQGYRATGINQILAESGVAKASFYDHFPSKDDLLAAYVRETSRRELAELKEEVGRMPTARERFFGPLVILPPWFTSSGYRGCPLQNVVADVGHDHPVVQEVARSHREQMRAYFQELAEDLAREEPALARFDAGALADTYLLLFEGVLAVAPVYHDVWPVTHARLTLARLVDGG
jgi:AcrR family transcriptional regulator